MESRRSHFASDLSGHAETELQGFRGAHPLDHPIG
jgi:hypothetical protein